MKITYILTVVTVSLVGSAGSLEAIEASRQQSKPTSKIDRWESWRSMIGTWEGPSDGQPGKGTVKLVIEFALDERFLKIAATARYENAKGSERHEDFGFISFDRGRSKFVFRQFHSEGFVNQYTLSNDPKADGKLELTSETCENTPPGWRARETYKLNGETLEHAFELAAPGKPFERYTTATLKRRAN